MKIISVCFILIYSTTLFCSVPTGESLFKNVSNANVSSSTVAVAFTIKEIAESEITDQAKLQEVAKNSSSEGAVYKIFFNIDKDEKISLVQTGQMGSAETSELFYAKNILSQLSLDKTEVDKKIFYSSLLTLVLNRADGFNNFLKRHTTGHMRNGELVNAPKRRLIDSYKRYLYSIKDDPSLKNSLKSPLRPEKDEDRQRVNQLMKEGLFIDNGTVKLTKENSSFFWAYTLPSFKAIFSNEKKQLLNVIFEGKEASSVQLLAHDYILFDGTHDLPKFLSFKTSEGKIYYVEMKSLDHISEANSAFVERLEKLTQEYRNRKERVSSKKPIFIF